MKVVTQLAGTVEYNECPGYDTKQSDGEAPLMLELWGMQSTPLLLSLPSPLLVAPDRVLPMGQLELNCAFESLLFLHLNCIDAKLNCELNFHDQKIRRTLTYDIRKHWRSSQRPQIAELKLYN